MPYHKLVTFLRQGLKFLYKTATELERRWLKEALLPQPLPRPRLKCKQTDNQVTQPSRRNKNTREKPSKPAVEPSTHEHQAEISDPNSSLGSTHGVVEKPQESGPYRVHQVERPTAVKLDILEARLLSGLAIIREKLGKRVCVSSERYTLQRSMFVFSFFLIPVFHSVSKYQQTDLSRTNKDTREKPSKPAAEPSTHEPQVEISDPRSSPGSAYGVVKEPQKSGPNRVCRVESPTVVKSELWKSQLLSGLAIMQENRSSKRCVLVLSLVLSTSMLNICL